jgi:hypothetical protein
VTIFGSLSYERAMDVIEHYKPGDPPPARSHILSKLSFMQLRATAELLMTGHERSVRDGIGTIHDRDRMITTIMNIQDEQVEAERREQERIRHELLGASATE